VPEPLDQPDAAAPEPDEGGESPCFAHLLDDDGAIGASRPERVEPRADDDPVGP
jgi:hypothetical protein